MRMVRALLTLSAAAVLTGAPAVAQPGPGAQPAIVVSERPEDVAVTVYRDPRRDTGGFDLSYLNGFAVIRETRRIRLPQGPATIRFAGVAEGMIAVSAVIRGLPGGPIELNRDSKLLSPGALVDGSLGNQVTLRRTDPATGVVREIPAVIRSGSDEGLVVQTGTGFEALRCSGLPGTVFYDRVPDGLFAMPTLSVDTISPEAAEAVVTLTYLAAGFDWNADYVVKLSDDGATLDLFAWLTLANSNGESFADAELLAVAGTVNTNGDIADQADRPGAAPLSIRCWPMGSTADGSFYDDYASRIAPPPPPAMLEMYSPAPVMSSDLIVTGSRRSKIAELEALGDLKLYRVPFRSTVAANGQKQVALLRKQQLPYRIVYRGEADASEDDSVALDIEVRIDNDRRGKLALPLPQGRIAVFAPGAQGEQLIGESQMDDYAVGETAKFRIGSSPAVQLRVVTRPGGDPDRRIRNLVITNANPEPIDVEIDLGPVGDVRIDRTKAKIVREDGVYRWKLRVPANGSAALDYRIAWIG